MDDNKIFAKTEKGQETPIQTIRIYSQYIGMELGIRKCDMLMMKFSKRETTEEIELPNQESIRMFGEKITNTCEYWKRKPSR